MDIQKHKLTIAITDPSELSSLETIKNHYQKELTVTVTPLDQLLKTKKTLLATTAQPNSHHSSAPLDLAEQSISKYVQNILYLAVHQNASDIHIEGYKNSARLRFRIDGYLQEIPHSQQIPAQQLISRLKILAGLDIAEKRRPQDGRLQISFNAHLSVDFRMSTCPTIHQEKIVLRILNQQSTGLNIPQLGMTEAQQQLYLDTIEQPWGMILVTGPTGSGKTITLYSALEQLNAPHKNIFTIEDPVEIELPGVNQLNVNRKIEVNFTTALRAFLRQDPDIMMVGEIRDQETAQAATKAALTGHLILSTLHTNSAALSIVRLEQMNVPRYQIIAAVKLIVAQRLVRKLCKHCKQPSANNELALHDSYLAKLIPDGQVLFEAVGCSKCHNGYKGRSGIYELLPITQHIQELIMAGATGPQIEQAAIAEGMLTFAEHVADKLCSGVTSFSEIQRLSLL